MPRRLISTGSPFEKTYGYSRAVIEGDMCFVAGTTGYDYATMQLPEDAGEQARNILRTVAGVLKDAGFAMEDVVRKQIFITSRDHARPVLEACGEVFANIRPASAIYIISDLLEPGMKVEIEITAKRRA